MIIQNLPEAQYHASNDIGSSTAKLILRSPQLFHDAMTGVYRRKDSPALKLGRLAHMAVLEPDRFAAQVRADGPVNEKTGKEYGRDTKAWAEWEAANPGVIVVDPFITLGLERMPAEVRELFAPNCAAEASVFCPLPALKFQVKCRPDYLIGDMIVDLKTIDDVDKISRAITRYGYWFSHAWYRMVMKLETGRAHKFRLVFMEKNPPYRWRIVDLDPGYVMYADAMVERALSMIADGFQRRNWADPGEVTVIESLPDYLDDTEEDEE